MKKIFVILVIFQHFFINFLYANISLEDEANSGNIAAAYELARFYESTNDLKNALFWYKKIARYSIENQKLNFNINNSTLLLSSNLEDSLIENIDIPSIKETAKRIKKDKIMFEDYCNVYKYNETKNTVFQSLSSTFDLLPHHANYLLPATYDFKSHNDGRKHFETVFQISFKRDIFTDIFGFDERIGFAYTQRNWWQITETSAPFRETNYLPEAYVFVPYKNKNSLFKGARFGFLHESNGQGDEYDKSRSWNRLYLEGFFQHKGIFYTPRVWYKINGSAKDGKDNIQDYIGYADLNIFVPYKKHMFKLMVRNNFNLNDNRGAIQAGWTFPLFDTGLFMYLQYFYGYGESLIDYDTKTNRIGLGVAFSR